jgi:peroxiredoxin
LADFQEHLDGLEQLGVKVCALSVDEEEDAERTVRRHELGFPVGWGLDVDEVASKTGAYSDDEGGYLHATSFILRDGRVTHATYSSGPLGRLRAEHVIAFVRHASQG